jgi:large subunit ribosomal protein L4
MVEKMKYEILTLEAKKAGEIELDQNIFGLPTRVDILSRVIEWQLSKRRSGTHKTKTVTEISGTGKKMYRQKGTGSARHGSKRQIQFRGGAKAFGPVVRSHEYSLPKKVRKLGLKIALSTKVATGDLIILDNYNFATHKTKDFITKIRDLKAENALFVDVNDVNDNLTMAAANVYGVDVLPQIGANVYDIMRKEKLVLTVDAIKALEERLK